MTGRAAGFCAGSGVPGFANSAGGRGFWGRGRRGGGRGGRGWRNWFHATGLTGWQRAAMGSPRAGSPVAAVPPGEGGDEQDLSALKGQAEHLQSALDGIRRRIDEIEGRSRND